MPGSVTVEETAGNPIKEQLTASAFMARTYLREARVVSGFGQSSLLRLKYLKQEKPELVLWQQEAHSNGETYFAAELWVPARPCTTCRMSRESIFWPITDSIIARCSRLSWVWKRASPVKNSTSIHPILQISQGKLQPRFRMISGAR